VLIQDSEYHGWSYKTDGSLNKAPHFDTVKSFDKTAHSLWPLHLHTTANGLVFVNLEAGDRPSSTFEEYYGASFLETMASLPLGIATFYRAIESEQDFNWKALMLVYDDTSDSSATRTYGIRHLRVPNLAFAMSFSPSGSLHVFTQGFALVHIFPVSDSKTKIISHYYTCLGQTEEQQESFVQIAHGVEQRDWKMAKYFGGQPPTDMKGGYLEKIEGVIEGHAELERTSGEVFNPLARAYAMDGNDDADVFCAALENLTW
jgi:hypothetical protein